MKTKIEAIIATAATGTNWLADMNEGIKLIIGVLTVVWWIRLLATQKKDPKP